MSAVCTARVPTAHPARYLQQLGKHWAHNLKVTLEPERAVILFAAEGRSGSWPGPATATLSAAEGHLHCRLDASVPAQAEALKQVLATHLDRFAFREAPLAFAWEDSWD